jgi:hypothetical protein
LANVSVIKQVIYFGTEGVHYAVVKHIKKKILF